MEEVNLSEEFAARVRFVVLRHVMADGEHYDLMIDRGPALATWKCPAPPETATGEGMACERIGDHRLVYLEYEGPISGNRGHVTQHDAGECGVSPVRADRWCVRFGGTKLRGEYVLSLVDQNRRSWSLRAVV